MSHVTIYTKAYCPYCVRAKSVLDNKGVSYQEIRIDEQPELRPEMIERAGGRTTVPQIFIGERHIGGCDDMLALDVSGKLDPLLNS
ncbi:glutaredoxin 3 [Rheinheimera muenzenbergensis]|uniref:Glutaredoxin n=1 Tax=Rheinheimera muenzenbergensis TaxID=1193628 RepID=A0ABU8C300_9GAMM|nr:glutaredoxin 3 [Gammaproteobacteria bacterium]MBU1555521.1 glutaredoxin 3 [Gammaproteobacteria bacterium]MBU2072113.1 glutaredoxin 3 [Gammaproteobacteria bacterium]MBU2181589.1 glutaredoxin 3 [Gammaproteobacteria bacterium]MBU2203444.1 glutaredoxin 3 [Gammaproteobacteria bacterium]